MQCSHKTVNLVVLLFAWIYPEYTWLLWPKWFISYFKETYYVYWHILHGRLKLILWLFVNIKK